MNLHPDGPHEPRRGDPNPPEPEDATDPAGQHAVGRKLIERPRGQLAVLNKEPLGGRQGEGERMLRHRFGERPAVCRDREIGRQLLQGDKIHTSRVELQQSYRPNEREFVWGQILRRILRKDDIGPTQHIGPLRGRHIGQVQNVGSLADCLTDHTPSGAINVEHHN